MNAKNTILIDKEGAETFHPLTDLQHGDPFPKVLINPGKPAAGIPSRVFAVDNSEVAKRFWTVMVYREVEARYI